MTTLHPLTDSQRQMAEDNHDLVLNYLRMRRLDMNEYYDVVIFGYLRAVQLYDERPDLRKYKLSTIAGIRMRAALSDHFRALKRQKRSAVVYDFSELQEMIGSDDCPAQYEYAEAREKWAAIQPNITSAQIRALKLSADGYTCREISETLSVSPGAVYSRMYRLRGRMRRLAA